MKNGYVWVLEFINSKGDWEPTINMWLTEYEAEEYFRGVPPGNRDKYRVKKYARIGR